MRLLVPTTVKTEVCYVSLALGFVLPAYRVIDYGAKDLAITLCRDLKSTVWSALWSWTSLELQ